MKKITIFILLSYFLQINAQNYIAKDFIGYVNYMNISSVNVRFNSLLFDYPINKDQSWIADNKIKKISYSVNGQISKSQNYSENGNITRSEFDSGSKYIYSKDKNGVLISEFNNNKEFSTILEKYSEDGKLLERKSQFSNDKLNARITKIFYQNNKVVKTETYFNDKLEFKSVFIVVDDLLKNIIQTDYKIEVQPGQTRENENITFKYDVNNNCIEIVNINYFGQLKNTHKFEYNSENKLIKENYFLNEGKNSKEESGSIKYNYDHENRISEIVEKQNDKGSVINISYGSNKKIEKLVISSSTKAYSTYLPYSNYVGKNEKIYHYSYDNKNNLTEIKKYFNGDLNNTTQFLIEYY